MDKERLLRFLNQKYISKCEMAGSLPLGCNVNEIWNELLEKRYEKAIMLPLNNTDGKPYWYILTAGMISASENIVEELMEHSYDNAPQSVSSLEETFFTGYMEGAQISIQDAMAFLQSGEDPHDIEELMILNNRQAGTFAAENLLHPIDDNYLHNLAYILTNGLDNGGGDYRQSDTIDIPSMNNEKFTVPPAAEIPSLIKEFSSFLADTQVHPLIKSAAAQAWIMIVRPFPEGNERLARLLSSIILIRSGYSFFSEISLSSLIAKKSFEYFKAVANIIRTENNGDLTYFLDYYIQLLSSAVNTLKERRRNKEEETHSAEYELAQLPLSPSAESSCETDVIIEKKEQIISELTKLTYKDVGHIAVTAESLLKMIDDKKYSFTSMELAEATGLKQKAAFHQLNTLTRLNIVNYCKVGGTNIYRFVFYNNSDNQQSATEETPSEINQGIDIQKGIKIITDELKNHIDAVNAPCKTKIAKVLLNYISAQRYEFTTEDIRMDAVVTQKNISSTMITFMQLGLLKKCGKKRNFDCMTFCFEEKAVELLYSPEVLNLIEELKISEHSQKDRRIGNVLSECLVKGYVTRDDYKKIGEESRVTPDMQFARELGLIQRLSSNMYMIRTTLDLSELRFENSIKATLSAMYEIFGDSEFSQDMVIAKLDYSSGHISACLHKFTWLKILDCKKDNNRKSYQFLVNPTDNPECFNPAA